MTNNKQAARQNTKTYDLEDRTLKFAANNRDFIKALPKNTSNFEYAKQLIRSSASVGANYIEANEATELVKIFSSILEKSK